MDPTASSCCGSEQSYKWDAKSVAVHRESEGEVVPSMAVHDNAVGEKGPYFVHALRCRYARANASHG